jgi:FKBP-type peptidyl-prolyl cis-trans isomerase (trigger factor)
MVTKTINKLPKSQVEVTITVPWADIEPRWNEMFAKLASEVEVAGFRKGQAPANMVEPRIANTLQQEVFKIVMPQALIEALQGSNIVPIDYPQYNVTAFVKGGQLVFTAKVTERPTVKVGNYKILNAKRPPQKQITDSDIQKVIDDLFNRWKARNPQNAQATMDDIFAKGVGAESLADLKTKIKTDLENEAKYNNELDYEESILQEVEKVTNVDIPEVLIQDEMNRMMLSLQRNVSDRGMLLEEYLKTQNKTADQIKAEWRPQAERNVRMELGLSEIARNENVNITDEELQAEIDKIQDARVKSQFAAQEPRMHLRHALRQTKTLNLLKTIVK